MKPYGLLFVGCDDSPVFSQLRAQCPSDLWPQALEEEDAVQHFLAENDEVAIIVLDRHVSASYGPRLLQYLREDLGRWDTRLIVVSGDDDLDEAEQLLPYGVAAFAMEERFTGGWLSLVLRQCLHSFRRQRALLRIAEGGSDLVRCGDLRTLAGKILDLFGAIPGFGRSHRLFCLLDDREDQYFFVAGSGRFEALEPMALQVFPDRALADQCFCAGMERGYVREGDLHWIVLPTLHGERLLILLETWGEAAHVDRNLVRLLMNEIASSFDQLSSLGRLLKAHKATMVGLADLAEYKDSDTGEHVGRVARMTEEIAWILHQEGRHATVLTASFMEQIGMASVLHDVGKVAIPDCILLKNGKLDEAERAEMELHTVYGSTILAKAARYAEESNYLILGGEIARSHHERWDGEGYPDRLQGEAIPLSARIAAVVDVFDALVSKRPYKLPWPLEQAVAYIRAGSGSQFDPAVVEAFNVLMDRRSLLGTTQWTGDMSVGEAGLDNDHRQLLSLFNQLATAEVLGNRSMIEYILDDLYHYTHEHFAREEQYMQSMGFPELEAHRRIHEALSDRVARLRWQYHHGLRDSLSIGTLRFLTTWLFEHIMGEDKRYFEYATAVSSEPPGQRESR